MIHVFLPDNTGDLARPLAQSSSCKTALRVRTRASKSGRNSQRFPSRSTCPPSCAPIRSNAQLQLQLLVCTFGQFNVKSADLQWGRVCRPSRSQLQRRLFACFAARLISVRSRPHCCPWCRMDGTSLGLLGRGLKHWKKWSRSIFSVEKLQIVARTWHAMFFFLNYFFPKVVDSNIGICFYIVPYDISFHSVVKVKLCLPYESEDFFEKCIIKKL